MSGSAVTATAFASDGLAGGAGGAAAEVVFATRDGRAGGGGGALALASALLVLVMLAFFFFFFFFFFSGEVRGLVLWPAGATFAFFFSATLSAAAFAAVTGSGKGMYL